VNAGRETLGTPLASAPHKVVTTLSSRLGIQRIEARFGNDRKFCAQLINPDVAPGTSHVSRDFRRPSSSSQVFSHE
jgi:hypothetical protein